jgi:hypothetical protein
MQMPTFNAQEVEYLLEQGAALDRAVAGLFEALTADNKTGAYKVAHIIYSVGTYGFSVRLHGVTLVPRIEQIRHGIGQFPELLARISLCTADDDGRPSQPVFSFVVDTEGRFALYGQSLRQLDMLSDRRADYSRGQLSLALAFAIQSKLPSLED